MKKQDEILKINFILLLLTADFVFSGLYNKYAYRVFINEAFSRNLLYTCMVAFGLLGVLFLSRSNICRNVLTALSVGMMPAVVHMYFAYLEEYSFEIISTFLLCVLSIVRTYLAVKRNGKLPQIARTMLMLRYSIVMFAIMGAVAFVFIKT